MSRIAVLVRPENVYNYNNYPPLGLISVGSELARAGWEIRIVDCALEPDPDAAVLSAMRGAAFVGVTLLTSEVPGAYRVLELVRENSDLPTVVGGWHCTLFPEQMADSPLVDFVIAGDGEAHILAVAERAAARDLPATPTEKIYAKANHDLDELAEPDYTLDPHIEQYVSSYLTDSLSAIVLQPMRWLPYESSRGCPSQCTFCINVVTGNQRYRTKAAEKVVDEVASLVRRHGLTHVKIVDDNFFANIRRSREICQGLIDRDLGITWDGECRADYFRDGFLDDETLELCVRSGLVQLTLGIESGSPRTLEIMKKGITPEQAANAIAQCDKHGIIARSSFMIEVPGETIDDINLTLRFINSMRRYPKFTSGMGTFRPYPKCELTASLLERGLLKEPASLEEWLSQDVIDLYTSAEYVRPWQVDGRYSESAAYYQNMESSVRVGEHQMDRAIDRWQNRVFMGLARWRNRRLFYAMPFDKRLYRRFLTRFYARRADLERAGEYPLADASHHGGVE